MPGFLTRKSDAASMVSVAHVVSVALVRGSMGMHVQHVHHRVCGSTSHTVTNCWREPQGGACLVLRDAEVEHGVACGGRGGEQHAAVRVADLPRPQRRHPRLHELVPRRQNRHQRPPARARACSAECTGNSSVHA